MRVSKNAYYHWLKTKDTCKKNPSLKYLEQRIVSIFNASKQVYGSMKIRETLAREGLQYSRSYIALLMKRLGLKSILKKKFVVTTDSDHGFIIVENELNRNFKSEQLGVKWVSDITYIKVADQWNYLTTILDLADRKVIAWSLSEDMTTENTILKAWNKAIKNRKIKDKLIFHSDRGVQYASKSFRYELKKKGNIIQSMSRNGDCWDNAVAESFFKTIKYECLNRYKFSSYITLYNCIETYISWYNNERIHSSLGYLTPSEMELKIRMKNINQAA